MGLDLQFFCDGKEEEKVCFRSDNTMEFSNVFHETLETQQLIVGVCVEGIPLKREEPRARENPRTDLYYFYVSQKVIGKNHESSIPQLLQ